MLEQVTNCEKVYISREIVDQFLSKYELIRYISSFLAERTLEDRVHPSHSTNNVPQTTSIGDLLRIGTNFKHSLEGQTPIPLPSQSNPSFHSTTNNGSVTIGIRTFTTPDSKPSITEPSSKKFKASAVTLLDELIRDIDESTAIPSLISPYHVKLPCKSSIISRSKISVHVYKYVKLGILYHPMDLYGIIYTNDCNSTIQEENLMRVGRQL